MSNLAFSISVAQDLYSSCDPFPVNFDDAWQWLGYSTKANAKSTLISYFEEGVDFSCSRMKSMTGGRPSELILLSVDCFKEMGMLAKTDQGKQIRKYFLECEKIAKAAAATPKSQIEVLLDAVLLLQKQEDEVKAIKEQQSILDDRQSDSETRIRAIEAEQGRYASPSGTKYTILGYAKLHGVAMSLSESQANGRKACAICRAKNIKVEYVRDPRYSGVGLYPPSVLKQVFGF